MTKAKTLSSQPMPDFNRFSSAEPEDVIKACQSNLNGLSEDESEARLK